VYTPVLTSGQHKTVETSGNNHEELEPERSAPVTSLIATNSALGDVVAVRIRKMADIMIWV